MKLFSNSEERWAFHAECFSLNCTEGISEITEMRESLPTSSHAAQIKEKRLHDSCFYHSVIITFHIEPRESSATSGYH